MRAFARTPRSPFPRLLLGVLVAALVLSWLGPAPAGAADARLQRAEAQRRQVQARLDTLVARLDVVQSEVAEVEARLAELQAAEAAAKQRAEGATAAIAQQVRESYKRGSSDPTLALFTSSSPQQAAAQARLLALLAKRNRAGFESASAAQVRTRATAEDVEQAAARLRSRQEELAALRAQVDQLLAQAKRTEDRVRGTIAKEQAAKRVARARTARGSRSGGGALPGGAGPVVNGAACPVGSPRSYSDTWGAPRSGGRRHKGTDILAPRGTSIYAYETGTITRLTNSRVGGISIYMRGASGNSYYYTHLQGYVSGLRAGQPVTAGQHIAFNGDTGNARGTPHLHFEVMPGGGQNVNPYPYVKRACG